MSRPVGVTASAVVAVLGSILALVFAAGAVASLFIETPQPRPPNTASFVVMGALMFVAFACIGLWTSVGLFRLRPWARTSILVFAGLLAAGSLFGLLIFVSVPIYAVTPLTENTLRLVIAWLFGVPLVIAVWWLIQFNTRSTKAAFASSISEAASPRPLSVTIIAGTCIFGGVSCVLGILSRIPAFLFGGTFNGWTAGVIYALFGALTLYIGKGLLELREEAWILAIGWFGFSFVHASLVTLVPPLRQRLLESQRVFTQNQPAPVPFDQGRVINVTFVIAGIVAATAIWFLIRSRDAFAGTEIP